MKNSFIRLLLRDIKNYIRTNRFFLIAEAALFLIGCMIADGVSYRPKLRGQWVPVLRLLAAAALAWVLINALVEAYGVGGCKS